MISKKCLLAALLPLMLASCETVIEFGGSETESKAVMWCNAEAGSPVEVCISKSIFFLNYRNYECNDFASGLESKVRSVKVTADGVSEELSLVYVPEQEDKNWNPDRASLVYRSASPALAGSEIEVEADIDGYGVLTGSTKVPSAPAFEVLDTTVEDLWHDEESGLHYATIYFTLQLADAASVSNWYRLKVEADYGEGFQTCSFRTNAAIFKQDLDMDLDTFLELDLGSSEEEYEFPATDYFADTFISGRVYSFKICTNHNYEGDDPHAGIKYRITLINLSEDLHRYMQSFDALSSASAGIISEYAGLYTNVTGGIGCVTSQASNVQTIVY